MSPAGRDPIENPEAEYPAAGFGRAELKVGEVEEGRRLQWSQKATMPSGVLGVGGHDRHVSRPLENGTKLTITRSGFGESDEWELFAQSTGSGLGRLADRPRGLPGDGGQRLEALLGPQQHRRRR